MPDVLKVVLALLPAVGLFFVIRTVVGRRIAQAVTLAKAEAAAARAGIEERLRGREEQVGELRATLAAKERRESELETESSGLRAQVAAYDEKVKAFETAESRLTDAFQNLASHALTRNNQQFLALAKENLERLQSEAKGDLDQRQQAIAALLAPMKVSLEKVDAEVRRIEGTREQAYGMLTEQVRSLLSTQEKLQTETGRLVSALRRPEVRGSWGEIQLKRTVEFAGMVDYVDFQTQETVDGDEGKLRPDLVVKLPGGKQVVVDSKAPLDAYLAAIEAPSEEARAAALTRHAAQVRGHLRKLAAKSYWDQFDNAPEFVVLFLPSEAIYAAALEHDPQLIEEGFQQSVLIVTPATLVALLKTIYYGWRQEALAANAREISNAAGLLYDRLRVFSGHLAGVGKGLNSALGKYNDAVASFDTRVLPQGRKLEELGATTGETLTPPPPLEMAPRPLAAAPGSPSDTDA
ncbi:MAG: DNA recombination protein RmuC [Thermoanaerobaculia bacterium]|nr:DNA recombination protein RmuC [Thermoanaerobaculia bacterium]